jgi:hypothetical protein
MKAMSEHKRMLLEAFAMAAVTVGAAAFMVWLG